jgi:acyl-CoA oxidase
MDDGMDPFDAFVDVQDHLVQCAQAEAERIILERFADAVEEVEESDLRDTLTTLRRLFGLSRIEAGLDWFLEAGYVSGSKAKAIRGSVNDLCDEVRPEAEALVEAFGIPDASLAAPIATEPGPGPV